MAKEETFARLLRESFQRSGDPAAGGARTRVDARTAGFAAENDPQMVEWMGMSPADGTGESWYVLVVNERPNLYLSQVDKHERLVEVGRVIGKGEGQKPLGFAQAVEHLAVWEHGRLMRGFKPAAAQTAEALGRYHYKDLALRRGFAVTTVGSLSKIGDILPQDAGKYLKSDFEALRKYREKLSGANALDQLFATHDPLFVRESTIEEDLQSFGELAVFDKIELAAGILVAYAQVKLQVIGEFLANPAAQGMDVNARVLAHGHFTAERVAALDKMRADMGMSMLRFFHFRQSDWDKMLDLDGREMKIELLKNPDARMALEIFSRPINYPMAAEDVRAALFVSARALVYCREMMKDSAQRDYLERRGVFRNADINDLLNFLDLLEIKNQYRVLAQAAFALPGTQRYREIKAQKEAFQAKVLNLKDNLKESGDFSAAQERQIDEFIKAGAQVYLIERMANLPQRAAAARLAVAEALLPKGQQLVLDLDYSNCAAKPVARPTRGPLPGVGPRP